PGQSIQQPGRGQSCPNSWGRIHRQIHVFISQVDAYRARLRRVNETRGIALMLANGSARACVRLVKRMNTRSRTASIQQLVPVNPVWPKASEGRKGPAVESLVAASCHANERASFIPSVMFCRKSWQVSFESNCDWPAMN